MERNLTGDYGRAKQLQRRDGRGKQAPVTRPPVRYQLHPCEESLQWSRLQPDGICNTSGRSSTDSYNINLDYLGDVAFTHRQRLLSTFLYELPIGKNGALLKTKNRLVDSIVGGWQLSGVFLAQTGPFMTVIAPGADPAGNNFPRNVTGNGRADRVSGRFHNPGTTRALITGSTKLVREIAKNNIGRPGNSPVGSAVGPGTQALSLSLFKSVDHGTRRLPKMAEPPRTR